MESILPEIFSMPPNIQHQIMVNYLSPTDIQNLFETASTSRTELAKRFIEDNLYVWKYKFKEDFADDYVELEERYKFSEERNEPVYWKHAYLRAYNKIKRIINTGVVEVKIINNTDDNILVEFGYKIDSYRNYGYDVVQKDIINSKTTMDFEWDRSKPNTRTPYKLYIFNHERGWGRGERINSYRRPSDGSKLIIEVGYKNIDYDAGVYGHYGDYRSSIITTEYQIIPPRRDLE